MENLGPDVLYFPEWNFLEIPFRFALFKLFLPPSILCTLNKFWKVIKEIHVPVQVQTHTADSRIARMECTCILGSRQTLCKCGVFILGSSVWEQALHHPVRERQSWVEHLWLFLSTQFINSSVCPSFCCSLKTVLLVGLLQLTVQLLWLALFHNDSSSGLSQLLMTALLQFYIIELIFFFWEH